MNHHTSGLQVKQFPRGLEREEENEAEKISRSPILRSRSVFVPLTRLVEQMGRAITRRTPIYIPAWVLPHRFLVFALHLDHDRQTPTTKGQ